MIADDAKSDVDLFLLTEASAGATFRNRRCVFLPGQLGKLVEDGRKNVGVVV